MKSLKHIVLATLLACSSALWAAPDAPASDSLAAIDSTQAIMPIASDSTAVDSTLAIMPIAPEAEEKQGFDAVSFIFGHVGDGYEFHITEINGHPISVPLPVIVRSAERGWYCFSSSKVAHGHEYEGFYIQKGGDFDGKIVEVNSQGEVVRPFDLSITKNVFALLLSCVLLMGIFIPMAKAYKKKPLSTPKTKYNLLEVVINYIEDDVIKPALGDQYMRFSPYLLTVFFFILINNLMGLIPIFPFGANLTGNISVTMILALFTYAITNLCGTREYYKDIVWPDVPTWLKLPIPLMPVIEFISTLTKPIALMIRLFANILAGHLIIMVLMGLIFIMTVAMGAAVGGVTAVVSILFTIFMYCLELLVAFIQAYVFTMLSATFIGMAQVKPHKEK